MSTDRFVARPPPLMDFVDSAEDADAAADEEPPAEDSEYVDDADADDADEPRPTHTPVTRRFAARTSPPRAPARGAQRRYGSVRRRRHVFSFVSPLAAVDAAEPSSAAVERALRRDERAGFFNVLSADGRGVSAFERALAELEVAHADIDALRTTLDAAAPRLLAAALAARTASGAAVRLRDTEPSAVQLLALRRLDTCELAQRAQTLQDDAARLVRAASEIGRVIEHVQSTTAAFDAVGTAAASAAAVRAALTRIAYPAESDEAARALLGAFAQRPHRGDAQDAVCVLCRNTGAELDGAALYRINAVCTMHAACAERDALCRCSTLFCEPCLVAMMRHTYAEQRATDEFDGTQRGIDPPRRTMTCPQCRLAFCFADMQRVELPPPAAKRDAVPEPESGKTPTAARTKRRRRAVRSTQ